MTMFFNEGSVIRVGSGVNIKERLEPKCYTVKSDMRGFFIEEIEQLGFNGKVYGGVDKTANRIINSFLERPNSTGVMLAGEKGSGKTMLTKILSQKLSGMDVPTIVINTAFCGEPFNSFIQLIDQPCLIIFDEFEKVYDRENQEKILTLLDGVYPSKKLFVLTINSEGLVNENMKNRPGRLYYYLRYESLTMDFIKEYCEDNLKNKSQIESICAGSTLFFRFNFDSLKAIVEEMNRYGESFKEVIQFLNTRPEFSYSRTAYKIVELKTKNKDGELVNVPSKNFNETVILDIGSAHDFGIWIEDNDDDDDFGCNIMFSMSDLTDHNLILGDFTFENNKALCKIAKVQAEKARSIFDVIV